MSQNIKTPKSVIITLVAGFGLGAVTMATVQSGFVINKAYAQTSASAHPISSERTESLAELHNLDDSFANLADFVAPSVVDIHAKTKSAANEFGQRMPVREGEGSGFIIRADGYIMTNDHVVNGADEVTVTLKDGREFTGKVVSAMESDIAIVKIEAKDLPVLAFGDSSEIRPGQMVMAVGAPFGLENSVTFGHVSALGRDTDIGTATPDERYYPDLIQTDASINMGNSGGPLVNIDGQVVGVNTAIFSPSGTSAGIGFAIPSNQAKFISDMLIQKGKVTRAMIGLVPSNLKEYQKKEKGIKGGAVVSLVQPDSAAAKAGIKKDDIVTKIGSSPINSQLDLRNAMLVYTPNTTVPVEILRNGKPMTVNVKLEAYKRPEAPQPPQTPMEQLPNGQRRYFNIPKGGDRDMFDQLQKQFDDIYGQGDERQPRSPRVNEDVPALKQGKAKLGVQVAPATDQLRKQFSIPSNVSGAVVLDVQPGSVADDLGMKAGDIITQLGDTKIENAESLTQSMADVKWGDTKRVKFNRYANGGTMQQDITAEFK
jgi:serine protease Do